MTFIGNHIKKEFLDNAKFYDVHESRPPALYKYSSENFSVLLKPVD
jgi:hypothetical protein